MRERFGSAVAAEGEADLFFDADDIVVCVLAVGCYGSAVVQRKPGKK
jgi:hypothetical protein